MVSKAVTKEHLAELRSSGAKVSQPLKSIPKKPDHTAEHHKEVMASLEQSRQEQHADLTQLTTALEQRTEEVVVNVPEIVIPEQPAFPEIIIPESDPPVAYRFTVNRDHRGYIESVDAHPITKREIND